MPHSDTVHANHPSTTPGTTRSVLAARANQLLHVRASCTSVVSTMSAALGAEFAHSASLEMRSALGYRGPAGADSGLVSEGHAAPLAAVCSVLQQFLRQDAAAASLGHWTVQPFEHPGRQ